MGRISKTNRFDEGLYKRAREISQNTRIPFSKLLDEGLKYLVSKYSSQSMPEPEPVSPVVEKTDTKQIVITLPKPIIRKSKGSLRSHNNNWYGRVMVGVEGTDKNKQREIYLGTIKNMTREEARAKLDSIIEQIYKHA